MKPDLSSASIYNSFEGLSQLKLAAKQESPEALQKVAEQFEAMFLQMLLKQMRDANIGEGLFDSDKTRFYQDMMDQQLSVTMAEKRGMGIAESIVRQLQQMVKNDDAENGEALELNALPPRRTYPQTSRDSVVKSQGFSSPGEYINTMRPYAEKAAQELGISVGVLLAQSALETGWGQKIMHTADGRNSHNLFGIKAGSRWSGDSVRVGSLEYRGGVAKKEYSDFRVYESYEESFRDYVNFIKSNDRYQSALKQAGNGIGYINALQEAGYATDPNYADKVGDIMQREKI